MAVKFANVLVGATDHARDRWRQLCMVGNPEYITAKCLFDALKRGAVPDKQGAVHVWVGNEVYAVVVPELSGGWGIVTFYLPGVKLDEGKDKADAVAGA